MITLILDNGHGNNTSGKRSPDGKLREYAYCRDIVRRIADELAQYADIRCEIIVPEEWDVTLEERCRRVNAICKRDGTSNCLFISVHNNAAGNGAWMSARGWSGWVYRNGSANSKRIGNLLYDACVALGYRTRKPKPDQKYWDCGFYILKHTNCPAVLTENFFQDNHDDVDFLLSEEGRNAVVAIHVNAVLRYYREVCGTEPARRITGSECAMK